MQFRNLRADEIDVRVATVTENGCTLLLYKDARCDMNILDETVGSMNWQRVHTRDNANCIVSLWDEKKKQWISKEDTGTESFTEKEKGLASDSFKRACFNWGIGRELYTSPFIFVKVETARDSRTNKFVLQDKFMRFEVDSIEYENNVISSLVIKDGKGNILFTFGEAKEKADDFKKKAKAEQSKITKSLNKGEVITQELSKEELLGRYNGCLAWLKSTDFKKATNAQIDTTNRYVEQLKKAGLTEQAKEIEKFLIVDDEINF